MNRKRLEKAKRRCRLGFANPKKDPWARRRASIQCIDGQLIFPKEEELILEPESLSSSMQILSKANIKGRSNWWTKLKHLWIRLKQKILS